MGNVYRKVELAASSYLKHMLASPDKTCLSHIAEIDESKHAVDGGIVRVFCRVKPESVLPDSSLYGEPHTATCKSCLKRFKKVVAA